MKQRLKHWHLESHSKTIQLSPSVGKSCGKALEGGVKDDPVRARARGGGGATTTTFAAAPGLWKTLQGLDCRSPAGNSGHRNSFTFVLPFCQELLSLLSHQQPCEVGWAERSPSELCGQAGICSPVSSCC